MNIYIGNSTKCFFPFYSLNDRSYNPNLMLLFIIIYVLLHIISAIMTLQVCIIIKNVHVFHPNMSAIIISILSQWFEILIAKCLIFPYQIGSILIGNEDQAYHMWVTSDVSKMPSTQYHSDILPLFIGGIMFLHYGFTVVFSVFTLTCERACATYFISDYEKKPRAYICKTLIISNHAITFVMSCLATFEIISFTTGIGFSIIVIIGAVGIYFFILHINIKVQNRLDKRDNLNYYSLAIRFQAAENAKSLKLAKKIVIFAAFAIIMGMLLLVLVVFHWIDSHVTLIVFIAEIVFNLNPLLVIPVGLSSVHLWRERYFQTTPIINKWRITQKMRTPKVSTIPVVKEVEVYFNQLSAAWK